MSDKTQTRTQHLDGWKAFAREQVRCFDERVAELGTLEQKNVERMNATIDQISKASRATVAFAAELGAQWRGLVSSVTKSAGQN